MNEPIIEASHLTKVFRDFWRRPKVRAVNDISFTVNPGEVFGLLGPNGSGKSTTIKMLLGLLHPSGGTIRVLGRPPADVAVKARIGYLPEVSHLHAFLTPRETLHYYGRLFGFDAGTCRRRTEALLEMVDLVDPVEVGHNTTYRVTITNQGSAPDRNIRITCIVPDAMKYISSSGPTKGTLEGNKLTFEALPSLDPKAKTSWDIVVEALKPCDCRFEAHLISDMMTSGVPAVKTEPTHLYK